VLKPRLPAGDGSRAPSSRRPHCGLGRATGARVAVRWPGGGREEFGELSAGKRWRLVQGGGRAEPIEPRMTAAAAFAALEPRESAWNPEPVARVPLAARLPLAPFAIPGFEDPGRTVSDLTGAPALIVLFTAAHPGGEALLAGLARRAAELGAHGLQVVPLATDQGPALSAARALAERLGLASTAGYADGGVLETFEMAVLEVLGYFTSVPAPLGFLLDARGNLVVLYPGLVRAEELLADLETLASYEPGSPGTGRFGGGRWLVPRARNFAELAQAFSGRGHAEIGRYYASLGE
jgi:hypothetical protein